MAKITMADRLEGCVAGMAGIALQEAMKHILLSIPMDQSLLEDSNLIGIVST